MEHRTARSYVAELVGTFVLVVFITLAVSINSRTGLGFTDWAAIGLVQGLALMLVVAALAGVSGANFNPAVTITLAAMRKLRWGDASIYILMQLAGATLAALVTKSLLLDEGRSVNYGATLINKAFFPNDFAGAVAEGLGTFALMMAIVGTAVIVKNKSALFPWVIGATLAMGVMAIGPMTGAGFNPARAFGPLLVSGTLGDNFGTFIVTYTLGPIIGALLAGFLVRWLYSESLEEAEIVAVREDVIDVGEVDL